MNTPGRDDETASLFSFFNEIGIIAQLASNLFAQSLPGGLTQSQFSVLNWFARVDSEATPKRLATAFQVTPGAMTNTLKKLAEKVADKALLVMRTYFEKPRSVVGWKGLLYDPLDGAERTSTSGLSMARRLAARINQSGLPCATEFLNPLLALYLEDLFAYGSIGSRTSIRMPGPA